MSIKRSFPLIALIVTLIISCDGPKKNTPLKLNENKTKMINSDTNLLENQMTKGSNDTISEIINIDFDTLNLTPRVINNNHHKISVSNIPAMSYNGRYTIISYNNYSCCYYDGTFLQINKKEFSKTIQISPQEDIEWNKATIDSIKTEIKKQLASTNSYYGMTLIKNHNTKILRQHQMGELSIQVSHNNEIYESKPFKIDSIRYTDSRCCLGGDIKTGYICKIFPEIMNTWIDARKKMILLEYGIVHGLNGCDRGPFFKTVDLTNN